MKIKIGIFATSSPLEKLKSEADYSYLRSKNLLVYEHPQVRIKNGYLAGTIKDRVDAIHEMLEDNSITILMAYWGGANTN
ncbi:MAG TPA: LD-carboxypeptidase [Oligoflexia bacterium]|nr:LD-carboxypeptidase [Oligoflexia bacterium]HMP27077.1 LD-carboxypeptidase [Oligoflexia bacterium]